MTWLRLDRPLVLFRHWAGLEPDCVRGHSIEQPGRLRTFICVSYRRNYYLWIRGNDRLDCPPRICTFKGHWTVDPSRVASDARHMAYGERVQSWLRFRDWRASQESPLVACQWPRSSSPDHQSRGHALKPRQQNIKRDAHPPRALLAHLVGDTGPRQPHELGVWRMPGRHERQDSAGIGIATAALQWLSASADRRRSSTGRAATALGFRPHRRALKSGQSAQRRT